MMKKIIRRIIRKIINWAYGTDIGADLTLLFHSRENLKILLNDALIRSAVKGGTGVKEEDLHLHFKEYTLMDEFMKLKEKGANV